MVFNSTQNNTLGRKAPEYYAPDYDHRTDENLQVLSHPQFKYKPLKTEVVSYIQDDGLEGGASKTGRFFKRLGKSIKKEAFALDRATRPMQGVVRQNAYALDRATRPMQVAVDKATMPVRNEVKEIAFEMDRGTRPLQKKIARSTINKNGLIHNIIESTADVVLPMAGTAIGAAIGTAAGNPVLGAMAGKATGQIVRKTLNKQTGYGKKPSEDVKLNAIINKYVPNYSQDCSVKPVSSDSRVKKAPSARNILVKKVMKEHPEFSLPQASKYIKENNLY